MMRKIILTCLSLVAAGMLHANDSALSLFNAAAESYNKGEYRQAIAQYESLRADHGANAVLYYNLANAYYRDNQLGRAILNYERAKRLAPHDDDIGANLAFIRQQIKEPEAGFADSVTDAIAGIAPLNGMLAVCSLLFIGLVAALIVYLFTRRRPLIILNVLLFVVLVIAGGALCVKIDREVLTGIAIVVRGPADIRNGPGNDASVGFTLPEGRKVTVLGESGDWLAVGLPAEGLRGWVEKGAVETL